jgi:predicted RNA-binding Zn ribbon-like protein
MSVSSSGSAPHDLELVIDFVNTLNLDLGLDDLSEPDHLAAWLDARGLVEQGAVANAAQLARAHDLREALRTILVVHNDAIAENGSPPSAALESIAERGRLSVRFAADGSVRVAPRAMGVDGALAALLAPIARASADGSWARVKACADDGCQWAFYDRSRNRSGRWCDMAECGNRAKVRAYRTRRNDVI